MVKVSDTLAVGIGAALGSAVRLIIGAVFGSLTTWPFATLAVNLFGSLLMGYLAVSGRRDGSKPLPACQQQFWLTGVCGGFTTFSLFSLELLQLVSRGEVIGAVCYMLLTLLGGCGFCYLGMRLASRR